MGGKSAPSPGWLPGAVWLFAIAGPVATWGLIPGNGGADLQDPKYGNSPGAKYDNPGFDVDPLLKVLLGVGGAAAALAVLVPAILAIRSGKADPRWGPRVLVPLTVMGVIAGLGLRIAGAPTIGANIGAAMATVVILPLVCGLLFWAMLNASRLE